MVVVSLGVRIGEGNSQKTSLGDMVANDQKTNLGDMVANAQKTNLGGMVANLGGRRVFLDDNVVFLDAKNNRKY